MGTFPLLTDDLLDTSRQQFDFTQSLTDALGTLGTGADGFDEYLADTTTIILGGSTLGVLNDIDLGTAGEIANSIDPNSLLDVGAALPGYLAEGEAIVTDASTLLAAITGPPTPPGGGGGGGGGGSTPSSDCSHRTNQYGLSATGTFPGVKCDQKLTFQILRVQDGPCTYSAYVPAHNAVSSSVRVVSFSLISGDSTVWSLGSHIAHASDGTPYAAYDVTVTPKVSGAKSHFDGVAVLVTQNPNQQLHFCMSVDCIP
jgi:hypothetical protein